MKLMDNKNLELNLLRYEKTNKWCYKCARQRNRNVKRTKERNV